MNQNTMAVRDIKRLREAGRTFEEIGQKAGVTEERIRQIINQYYPGTNPKLVSECQALKIVGSSYKVIRKLRGLGLIHPLKMGRFYRYDKKTLKEVRKVLGKACVICGNPIPTGNKKYCTNCSEALMKEPAIIWSVPGMREKHNASIQRYRKTHRGQIKTGLKKSDLEYTPG